MTLVLEVDNLHKPLGEAKALPRRRRRLSTIVKQHAPKDRATVALVFRKKVNLAALTRADLDQAARMRADYATTLVGPDDHVVFVRPALGGSSGLSVALMIASAALLLLAPWAAAAVGGGLIGFAVQTGMVIGAALLQAAAAKSNAAKKTDNSFYDIAPSGNVAKRGARRPLGYGRCWSTPPLSQRDFIRYIGNKQTVLVKRLLVGLGKWDVLAVKVGESTFWTKAGGVQSPFNVSSLFGIPSEVEVLYEQASKIVPGDIATSESVIGQELPRSYGNPDWTPWYRATPHGVKADKLYLAWSFGTVMVRGDKGEAKPNNFGISFQFQRLDPVTGNPTGPIITDAENIGYQCLPEGGHFGREKTLPEMAEWQVRSCNPWPDPSMIGIEASNTVYWDELSALLPDVRVREGTTEVVIRVSGIKGISSLGEVRVEAERIVPVFNGSTWVEQPTRKAVWAFADLIRSPYGLNRPDGVDGEKCLAYANRADLAGFDEFNGFLDEVTTFGVALNTVLGPLRAQHQRLGQIYSFMRDESAEEAGGRQVITRQQILADTTAQRFIFTKSDSSKGDVIVEYLRDGDEKRPDEARQTKFSQTRTPKRYKFPGVTSGAHAVMLANWLSAIDKFRGAERTITTEWQGRLIYPATHILSDLWFVDAKAALPGRLVSGTTFEVEAPPPIAAGNTYVSLRGKEGNEWGILRAVYDGGTRLTLNATDVSNIQAATGVLLADVLTGELQEPNTLTIGPLVELQETYIARSTRPVSEDHIEIEMVIDNPKVWQILGEETVVPGPIDPEGPVEPLRPNLPSIRAWCERTETDIQMVWSVPQPFGAVAFDVQYAIDEVDMPATDWTEVQTALASASGSVVIRQSPLPVRVRGRAIGRTGVPGDWTYTTFSTVPPRVDGGSVDIVNVTLNQIDAYFRGLLEGTGPGSIGEALNVANSAQSRANSAFGNIEDLKLALSSNPADRTRSKLVARSLRDDLDLIQAAFADAQNRLNSFEGMMVQIGVVQSEGAYRIAGEAILDSRINSVAIDLDALNARVSLLASTIVDGDLNGILDTLNSLSVSLDAVAGEIALRATTAQLDEVDGRVTTLSTTLTGPEGTITSLASSVNTLTGQVSNAVLQLNALGSIVASASTAAVKFDGDARDLTLDALLARVAELEGGVNERLGTATLTLGARIGEMGEVIAESGRTILAVQGDAAARFSSFEQVMSNGFVATASAQRALETAAGAAAGRIGVLENVTTNAQNPSSVVSRLSTIEGTIGTGTGSGSITGRITTLEEVTTDPNTGLVRQLSDLQTAVSGTGPTSISARLTTLAEVVGKAAGPDGPASGLVSRVGNLELTLNGNGTPQNPSLSSRVSSVEIAAAGAAGNAAAAITAANNAASAAATADGKAVNAATAASNAASAASTADGKAVAAQTAASNAASAASTADGKAVAAQTAASNAASAASTADGKAVAAQTAASNAATAASTADGKAVAAQTKANAADTKAEAAQNAVTAVAGTVTEIEAKANDMTASGKLAFVAVSAPSGATAAWALSVKASNARAGFTVLAMSNGTSQVIVDAGQVVSAALASDGVNRRVVLDLNNGSLSFWR
ncbi:host specificity factor TipJ family phage tail protein [Enterovirga rhinocerotis]|uniref:Phage tail protein n=1 Tax=Enterovirga rhinocerotis TaxID=1339210 RepID=A0A4R7BWN4_9HYPH|nr:host specificity factor TipJ family phage tail protein [Enterovirga rhinocerotis]TDR90284.1 hypothetical protein EV668_3130 [Enterovirga rhinocerotis]